MVVNYVHNSSIMMIDHALGLQLLMQVNIDTICMIVYFATRIEFSKSSC